MVPERDLSWQSGAPDNQVQSSRIDQLYVTPYTALTNPAVAGLLVFLAWGSLPDLALLGWLAGMSLLAALRFGLRKLRNSIRATSLTPTDWENRMMLLVGANGALWGLTGVAIAGYDLAVEVEGAVTIAACGMIAGAIFSMTASFKTFCAYALPTALGPIIGLLIAGGEAQVALAGMGLIYLVVAVTWGRQTARALETGLRLRQENAALHVDLQAAHARLVEAERFRSDSFANIGHELRTPLNAIIGFAQSIDAEIWGQLGDRRYKTYASLIAESGRHLLNLIQDILEFSRTDTAELALSEDSLDLQRLLTSCFTMLGKSAQEAGVELTLEKSAEALWVLGDPTKLRQIVINLGANALQFTPRGGTVTLRAERTDLGETRVHVIDTGIGMSQEEARRALEPYTQIMRDRSGIHKGLGLGLTLSKRIAELHGGFLSISSEVGKGTQVTVALPSARSLLGPPES